MWALALGASIETRWQPPLESHTSLPVLWSAARTNGPRVRIKDLHWSSFPLNWRKQRRSGTGLKPIAPVAGKLGLDIEATRFARCKCRMTA